MNKTKMMTILIIISVLASLSISAQTETKIIVKGTDDPSVDIVAVQSAIDTVGEAGGGKVVLEGDFDFGAYGRVTIPFDNVTLEGEKNGVNFQTSIQGGSFPVLIGQDLKVADHNVLDKLEIPLQDFDTYLGKPESIIPVNNVVVIDIHFIDPYFIGVGVTGSKGDINITGNKFTDARPINDFWGHDYMAKAILVFSGYDWDPTFLTGNILITDNIIDGRFREDPSDPDAKEVGDETGTYWLKGLDHGILLAAANVATTIKDNNIINVGEHGIFVAAYGGTISAEITYNRIQNSNLGQWPIPTNENLTESGMNVFGIPGVVVANNVIDLAHPWAFGINIFASEGLTIKNNQVHTDGSLKAVSIEDDVYNSIIEANKITGSGHTGIWLGWPGYSNENNTIKENDLKGFTPITGHDYFGIGANWGAHIGLYWGASNNTIKDNKYSAVDWEDKNIQNIYFSGVLELPWVTLPGATGNVVRDKSDIKIIDYTDITNTNPYGPIYYPDTYNGDNDIVLGHYD
jgi:hypothetical protein